MALTLQSLLPPTRSARTFYAASSLLGLAALAQLVLMGVFLLRSGGIAHRAPAPSAPSFAETLQPPVLPAEATAPPLIAAPTPAPPVAAVEAPPTVLAPDLSRPTPAPALQNNASTLVEQARQLRQRGDMPSALARLREAQGSGPDNPQIIAEMALTYEAMQLPDRAFEQWQRIYNLGESIGALYYLADSKLHAVPSAAAGRGSVLPAFQENAVLKLTDVHVDRVPDPAADKVVLKIVVKNRPGTGIDPTRVRILTYFYDLLDGRDVVLTDAQTSYAWVSPPPIDWAGDRSEVLETTYFRPKDAPPAAPTPAPTVEPTATPAAHNSRRGSRGKKGDADAPAAPAPSAAPAPVRTYLGYIVRLYYDRQLQDDKADPVMLLQRFPSPSSLAD